MQVGHVVLLHGINNTPGTWTRLHACLQDLMPEGAVTIDTPLLGECADVGDIAEALLCTLPPQFVVVGHSFGGYVALELLHRAPRRVLGLGLVNSHDGADSAASAGRREQSIQTARAGGFVQLACGATAASYHPDHLDDRELMDERRSTVASYGVDAFVAHQRAAAHRVERRSTLVAADLPLLVVAGDDDRVVPVQSQREMARAIGATFVLVERAGHMLPAEQPLALATVLAPWLTDVFAHASTNDKGRVS